MVHRESVVRILITGAAGFIGSQVFARFAQAGVRVAGFIRDSQNPTALHTRRLAKLDQIASAHSNPVLIRGKSFSAAKIDIVDFSPTVCVHLAGRSSVRESLKNPGLYVDANVGSTIELLETLRAIGCNRVVHASSVMVYGKDAPSPYHELELGTSPASFYGASKLAAETLLNTYRMLHRFEAINLRLFSVYGPDLRPDSVPHLIASAIRDDREFNIFGDGSSVRDYVEIRDVVDAIEAAVRVEWSANFPGTLNIGSGVGTPLLEVLRNIEQGMCKKARLVYKPAVEGELKTIVAGIENSGRFLGWKPRISFREGVGRFTEWFGSSEV